MKRLVLNFRRLPAPRSLLYARAGFAALVMVAFALTVPADARQYQWTVSSSGSGACADAGSYPAGVFVTLHLWFMGPDLMLSSAMSPVVNPPGALSIVSYTADGMVNVGTLTNMVLTPTSGFCTGAPVHAGTLTCFTNAAAWELCLGGSGQTSTCGPFPPWPHEVRGFANNTFPTCLGSQTACPSNLVATHPPGWYGPVVPRVATDTFWGYGPLPATLPGNTTNTHVNWAAVNSGIATAPNFWSGFFLDDVMWVAGYFVGVLPPGASLPWVNSPIGDPPLLMAGGRHHLRSRADIYNNAIESNELDNNYTDWFVWSPPDLADDAPVQRPAPPIAYPIGSGPYPSSDGFRVPAPGLPFWTVIGVIHHDANADYDVRLHAPSTGSKDGFGAPLSSSLDPLGGRPDFVLVNYNEAARTPLDVSVTNSNGGWNNFWIHRADAGFFGTVATGTSSYGPATIPAFACQDIIEFFVPPSLVGVPVHVELDNVSGDANLAVFVYDGGVPYHSKTSYTAFSDAGGPGDDEHVAPVTFSASRFHAVVVAKSYATEIEKDATYRLVISTPSSAVDAPVIEVAPRAFALSVPSPNPFRQTTSVELAVPAGQGAARVSVYDVHGRRVAMLAELAAPGRHIVTWDGRDASGREAAAGVYFMRLEAASATVTRKISLLR